MRVTLNGLGDVGWLPDQVRTDLPANAITDISNFRMRNGWAERVHGSTAVFANLSGSPYHLTSFVSSTARNIIHATKSAVFADASGIRTEITPSGGGLHPVAANLWTSTVLNGIFAINNGADQPYYWTGDTSTQLAALPGWQATWVAKAICSVENHWVALGMTESGVSYPHRVRMSAKALPGSPGTTWDVADPTNDADYRDVTGDGVLVWGLHLGADLIIYKSLSCSVLSYIGGDEVWSLKELPIPHGILAPNCAVNVPGVGHVVLTSDDVIVHDGTTSRSILDGKAKDWLLANMNATYYASSYVVADFGKAEVQICFPTTGYAYCTKAIIWNWRTEELGQKDLANMSCGCRASFDYATESFDNDSVSFDSESTLTFDASSAVFGAQDSRVLMAAGVGGSDIPQIYDMESYDAPINAIGGTHAYVEFGALCNLVQKLKGRQLLISGVWIDVDIDPGMTLSVSFGASQDPTSAIIYNTPKTFTAGTDRKVDDFVCGAYPAIKIDSIYQFRIRSMAIEIEDAGEY